MPLPVHPDRVEIVLVSPRNPLNIGAVARAMANFGFRDLTVVSPYEPHWREAKSAIGAEALLQSAKCTQSLADAIAHCTLVLGTASLESRQPEQPVIELPDAAPLVRDELAHSGQVAIVFGPEKRGLTREDLALCHRLLTIPTHSNQPSMNLGQAVAVCLYQLSTHLESAPSFKEQPTSDLLATAAVINQLAGLIGDTTQASGYSPAIMRAANQHDTQLLLRRLRFTDRDARRALGFLRRILWRLRR